MNVPRPTAVTLRSLPVAGTTYDATAAIPNAMEPAKFRAAIHQLESRRRQKTHRSPTANHASALAIKKQIDPNASGTHTCLSISAVVVSARLSAMSVVRLKKSVPTNWTLTAPLSTVVGAPPSIVIRHCIAAAAVKKSDPTKYVTLLARTPTHSTNFGTAATAKHAEPTMKSTPIRHNWERGDHHTVVDPFRRVMQSP